MAGAASGSCTACREHRKLLMSVTLEQYTTRAEQVSTDCGRHSRRLDLFWRVSPLQFYVRLHAKTNQRDTRKCSWLAPLSQCFPWIWVAAISVALPDVVRNMMLANDFSGPTCSDCFLYPPTPVESWLLTGSVFFGVCRTGCGSGAAPNVSGNHRRVLDMQHVM